MRYCSVCTRLIWPLALFSAGYDRRAYQGITAAKTGFGRKYSVEKWCCWWPRHKQQTLSPRSQVALRGRRCIIFVMGNCFYQLLTLYFIGFLKLFGRIRKDVLSSDLDNCSLGVQNFGEEAAFSCAPS